MNGDPKPSPSSLLTRSPWLVALLLTLGAFAVYWPAISGPFLWDDEGLIKGNPLIKSPVLAGEVFQHRLHLGSSAPYYRPMQSLSFIADYYFSGLDPHGYHVTNILIHAAAACALYLLLRLLIFRLRGTPGEGFAFAVAFIWCIHPTHNAAVAYISGRADPLSFLFCACAWLAYEFAGSGGTFRRVTLYSLAAGLGLAGLISKEVAIGWFVLFLFYQWGFSPGSRSKSIATTGAILALVAGWWMLRQLPDAAPSKPVVIAGGSVPAVVVLFFRALGDYVSLLVAPVKLWMERKLWTDSNHAQLTWLSIPTALGWRGILGLLAVAAGAVAAMIPGKDQRLRRFCLLWFAVGFLPISGLVPINAQVAEHWIYFPSAGAILFLGTFVAPLANRWRGACAAAVGLWICALGTRTWLRAEEWSDPVRFYRQTLVAGGTNARIVNNLAIAQMDRGDVAGAEKTYRAGLRVFPENASLIFNFANFLTTEKRLDEALEIRRRVPPRAKRSPGGDLLDVNGALAEARALVDQGDREAALNMIRPYCERYPDNWRLAEFESVVFRMIGDEQGASRCLAAFVAKNWWQKDAHLAYARILHAEKNADASRKEFREAARLDVWDPVPWTELAKLELELGRLDAARDAVRTAMDRAPEVAMNWLLYAAILQQQGQAEPSRIALEQARVLAAKSGEVLPGA